MRKPEYECWLLDIFEAKLLQLKRRVMYLRKHNPDYLHHATTKLLLAVWKVMRESLADPDNRIYSLGDYLEPQNRNWRRCKKHGLPERYRLFFQFRSENAICIYAWLNDERTLRNDKARTDVYAVFESLIKKGIIPGHFLDLLERSRKAGSDHLSLS